MTSRSPCVPFLKLFNRRITCCTLFPHALQLLRSIYQVPGYWNLGQQEPWAASLFGAQRGPVHSNTYCCPVPAGRDSQTDWCRFGLHRSLRSSRSSSSAVFILQKLIVSMDMPEHRSAEQQGLNGEIDETHRLLPRRTITRLVKQAAVSQNLPVILHSISN